MEMSTSPHHPRHFFDMHCRLAVVQGAELVGVAARLSRREEGAPAAAEAR